LEGRGEVWGSTKTTGLRREEEEQEEELGEEVKVGEKVALVYFALQLMGPLKPKLSERKEQVFRSLRSAKALRVRPHKRAPSVAQAKL